MTLSLFKASAGRTHLKHNQFQ